MTVTLFTDLDGTLLFSESSLPHDSTQSQWVPIETYANHRHGYIEKDLLTFLSTWSQTNHFIPITTRSTAQFERLNWPTELTIPYALTSNGGNLYRFGSLDPAWYKQTQQLLNQELKHKEQIHQWLVEQIPKVVIKKIKEIDYIYFCLILSSPYHNDELFHKLTKKLATVKWCAYFQGKKWYILPQALSKEVAIQRLTAEFTQSPHIKTMGDTTMDLAMIQQYPHSLYFGKSSISTKNIHSTPYRLETIRTFLTDEKQISQSFSSDSSKKT